MKSIVLFDSFLDNRTDGIASNGWEVEMNTFGGFQIENWVSNESVAFQRGCTNAPTPAPDHTTFPNTVIDKLSNSTTVDNNMINRTDVRAECVCRGKWLRLLNVNAIILSN